MRKRPAFTILELLISMALSSFVIYGLMLSYQNLMKYLNNSREMMQTNRKVCLLFNQLERDITTAFIVVPQEEIKPATQESDLEKANKERAEKRKKDMTKAEKEKVLQKQKEELGKFFLATIGQGQPLIIKDKKLQPFGTLTFLTSNSLQVFGEQRVRFVRVRYELEQDKDAKKPSYRLIRKETTEIKNHEMKETGFAFEKAKPIQIRKHIIADSIKALSIEYVSEQKETKKGEKKPEKSKKKEVRSFTWGDKEFSQGFVPRYLEIHVEFWNSDLKASHIFETLYSVLSYPTPDLLKNDEKKEAEEKHERNAGDQSELQEPQVNVSEKA